MKLVYVFAQHQPHVLPANEPSHKRCNASQKKIRFLFGGVIFFAIIDVFCKILALTDNLPQFQNPIISTRYFANIGIAFSIPFPRIWTLIITAILLTILGKVWKKTSDPLIKIAIFSIFLGALSNFLDRFFTGFTTDYLILFSRSAINIADLLIIFGGGYYLWYHQKTDIVRK